MEKAEKRQWMQSVNGKIRVGPMYQAMIPPFCRAGDVPKQGDCDSPMRENGSDGQRYTSGIAGDEHTGDKAVKMEQDSQRKMKAHSQYLVAEDFLISH
ncbi:pentatricopeptide repeat-containing mitochondrial, putative [Babesia ovata]|uniref:Pentatricopeptide repeat-containing mitochondrial, putative n=1 Tax=Babesia ovata TaxID=189622 RepID=A0A2H6K9W9_9APIC|nr:pentatricopeptide repeat-containing mitochondrial, putative [Babesia ovata]GBE59791.1 pentatricopeptide repeat-containing mitochondrial, putative [Babesia ovata]